MSPGLPLFVPRPLLSATLVAGLATLCTLAWAEHALPPALASACYAVLRTNANARTGASLALAVHVVEAAVAAVACSRAGWPPRAVLWWSGLSFVVGFPALGHALSLGRRSAVPAAKAD
jgi:hypothetical protein